MRFYVISWISNLKNVFSLFFSFILMQTQIVDDMIIQTDRNASDIDVENIVNLKKPVRFINQAFAWILLFKTKCKGVFDLKARLDCMYKFEVLFSCPNSLMVRKSWKQFMVSSIFQKTNKKITILRTFSLGNIQIHSTDWEDSVVILNFFERLLNFSQLHVLFSQMGGKIQIFTNFFHGDMNNRKELLNQRSLYNKIKGVLQEFCKYFLLVFKVLY